jgi:UDP-glucose 4-epimerase
VDDVVDALLLAALNEAANGQIYNLGSDDPINLLNLARLMIEICGSGSYELHPFPEERKRIDIGDFYGDYRRIRSKLGWRPKTSLREGLSKTIAFYQQNLNHYL